MGHEFHSIGQLTVSDLIYFHKRAVLWDKKHPKKR
jgi:hypothetical protein